jgi:hypothetical protein
MNDTVPWNPAGHVTQRLVETGEIIRDGHNLVVESALEVMLQCLMMGAGTALSAVVFGNSGSKDGLAPVVTPSMRTIPLASGGAVARLGPTTDTRSYTSKDSRGLRSIGTFTALYTPKDTFQYDTLGLISNNGLLFSVTSFPMVTLLGNQSVSVQWTIMLRGTR